ncbi:MAG: tRNA epoxyqueuosine(34) reductase QueG [Magnetococcales bacterium]|nr:tRNA epoxyqueuosine(34) reductase QueG [Magnetococcales bacterium]
MPHSNNLEAKLKEPLRTIALNEGFDLVAFAAPCQPPRAEKLSEWLDNGCHGDMAWMEKNREKRLNPNQLMPGLGTIMVLGINYRPPGNPADYLDDPAALGISAYAKNRAYQGVIKKKLKKVIRQIEQRLGRPIQGRLFVDTAPVMEKPLAAGAGLGWQGKNSLLVTRERGCWLFLAELFLDINLPADPQSNNHCGSCNRCQLACPTGALDQPWQLDATQCLAYYTIESSGPIPPRYRVAMGNRVFGCDDCLTICPWNRFAPETTEAHFLPRPALKAPTLLCFAFLDDAQFRATFPQSAIKRSGRIRFMRNLAVALGNWGSVKALPALGHLFADDHPLIRGHAAWGLARVDHPEVATLLIEAEKTESDREVLEEIKEALNYMVTSTRTFDSREEGVVE